MSKIIDDQQKILSQQTIETEKERLKEYEMQKAVNEKEERDRIEGAKMSEDEQEEIKKLNESNAKIEEMIKKDEQ